MDGLQSKERLYQSQVQEYLEFLSRKSNEGSPESAQECLLAVTPACGDFELSAVKEISVILILLQWHPPSMNSG